MKNESGYPIVKHVWVIRCSDGALHPQEFQAGRAPYGVYRTRKTARQAARFVNLYHTGHYVTKVIVPR